MEKLKLVLFGAAEEILQNAKEMIREDTCEIVAFCDNDDYKQELIYKDLRIIKINQLNEVEFDFIIVGAWYSYGLIKNNLLEYGIPNQKILPLLSVKSVMLLTEPIEIMSKKVLDKIFVEDSQKIVNKISELNEVTKEYKAVSKWVPSEQKIDFSNYPLIAHAGGGVINGRELIYSNSIEAFKHSIEVGFQMFEFDVYGLLDDDLIFGHDRLRMDNAAMSNYTPLHFTKMLSILSENPNFKVILDVKYTTFQHYVSMLEKMESIMSLPNKEWNYDIKQRLIMETYNIETIEYSLSHGWQCLLTNYRDGFWYQKSAWLCCKFQLLGIVLNAPAIWKQLKYLQFLKEKNVPILVQDINNLNEYSKLRRLGISSVMTNFLRPKIF